MPDVRLIDANALRKDFHTSYSDDLGILEHIDNSPTIDAQPVKYGKWIPNTRLPGQTGFHCSECMFTDKGTYSRRFKRYKRCPNCGAYMGGDADA